MMIEAVRLLHYPPNNDARGNFRRLYEDDTGRIWRNASLSHNPDAGTLRGLHFQASPHEEAKLVHCVAGRLFDVIVDMRPDSSTFQQAMHVELAMGEGIFVPPGCAHGFQTLENDTTVLYHMDAPYVPEHAAGIQWNDPALAIPWPQKPRHLSEKDAKLPTLADHLVSVA